MLGFQVITPQRHIHETKALSKFWTLLRQFGQNFWAIFHKGSVRVCKGNSKKVTKHATSFLENLRAPSEHAGAKRYKDQKLDVCSKLC